PEYIYLDKDRLRQVLANIIGNAIKFTEEGLIEVKLSLVMVGPKEADIKIEIKDTGIGIPAEKLDLIFGEFEQVDNIHLHYGGTGLGLAISRRIVRMLNGEISVKSELDRGSDFTILLKKVGIVDEADEKEESTRVQYYFEPAKVMIVDECLATRELFEAYLSVTRLTVRTYETAFDAIKDLEEFVPNLIITEISLRSMDGFQLAEEIRTIEGYKKTPII
ncbi:MAG: response regulator, partial [Cytophagales bacterium]|nr:response regulator [Cytophagales bacterium]